LWFNLNQIKSDNVRKIKSGFSQFKFPIALSMSASSKEKNKLDGFVKSSVCKAREAEKGEAYFFVR